MIVVPWSRQPVGSIKPASSNPLLSQATGLWVFSQPYNLLTGEPTVLSGAGYFTSAPQGIAARTVATTGRIQLASDSRNLVPLSGGFTVALHYRKIGSAAASAGFGLDASSSALIRAGTHFPFSDGTLYWDFGGNTAGTSRLTAAGLTYGDDFWVFTTGPNGMEIWQNGIRRAQQSSSVNWFGSSNPYLLGMHGTATNADDAECAIFLTAARQWSAAECAEWCARPWQVVEPVVLYAFSAGKSSSSTLDAAIQEAKTATATLNAAIQVGNTGTASLDGVISQQRTSTATLDAAIQAALTATTTLNAAIQAAMTGTSTLDAVISAAGSTSLTATLDAAIQEAKSLTATLDAAIQTSGSASATLNAVVVQVNTATATLDATVQAVVTAYALLDAYIFDADAPVEETRQGGAGRGRRRYIMPDDSVVFATPSEAEQLVKLFVKPVPPKKPPKRKVKTLNKLDLVEITKASSDTVPTERIVVKPKAVWENTDLYQQALNLMAQREILRKRREDELILLAA